MAVNDYQDKLFDAVSIVAESKVKNYHYDETIEAVIKDDSRADEGKYQVEYTGGLFDAYGSGERYYVNNQVYVLVPKGDFSAQKLIIGRKIDIDNDPGTTFNFRMPFDDFITLRSLTGEVNPAKKDNYYRANDPNDGKEVEADSDYIDLLASAQTALSNITTDWQRQMTYFKDNVDNLKKKFNDVNYETVIVQKQEITQDVNGHTQVIYNNVEETHQKTINTGASLRDTTYTYNGTNYRDAIVNILDRYVTINGNWISNTQGYLNAWNEIQTILHHYLQNVIGKEEEDQTYEHLLTLFSWDDADLHTFLTTIESHYNLGHASQNTSYSLAYNREAAQWNQQIQQYSHNETNNNLLWSWTDDQDGILIGTKLGISIDVQTLLGDYQPNDGQYGIRLVLMGTSKPTEDEMSSEQVTQTIYFTNNDMYGNTYGYYSPYTQQKILDISNLLTLTHIDCYFWQDHNFKDYNNAEIPYLMDNGEKVLPNIIVSNLQILLGMTADEATHDRVILYTYDDSEYGIAQNEIDDPIALARSDEKTLRVAWIHITDDGPIVVNREKKLYDSDIYSLEYWHAKIYWYNYQYGIAINESNEAEKYGGGDWKPYPFDKENETATFEYSDYNSNYQLSGVFPSREKVSEKYKVIILQDHTAISSNILQFNNRDINVVDNSFDSLYEVVFRFLRTTVSDEGKQSKIIEDNSLGNFFVYDENGNIICDEYGVPYSDMYYYVQIWIRNNETGDYSPATLDLTNGIQEVNWTPIGSNSMIRNFTEPSNSELEDLELNPIRGDLTDEQIRLIKMTTRRFQIQSKWVMSWTENFIRATVRKNNKIYTPQKELMFGKSGTMGTPYTLVLKQVEPYNGEMIQNEKFKIKAEIFERGVPKPNTKYNFKWFILSPTLVTANNSSINSETYGWISNDIEHLNVEQINGDEIGKWWNSSLEYSNTNGYQNNVISGYIRNDMPLIVKCICNTGTTYEIASTVGFGLVNKSNYIFNSNLTVQCPDRVEYKSDGTAPLGDLGDFYVKKKRQYPGEGNEFLFQDKNEDSDDNIDAIELYPEWKLFSYKINIDKNEEEDETTGQIISTRVTDGYLESTDDTCLSLQTKNIDPITLNTDTNEDIELPSHTVYRLSTTNNYAINGNYEIKGNSHAPANWYWDDTYAKDYYVVLQWQAEVTGTTGQTVNYWFKQAVPLVQNLYSSSLINTWDGKLLIDEDENAIMAKMIAAGSKNKKGLFTGIMMGDWKDKGDESLDIVGLYGFKEWQQTFGFRIDGTGFIGKSGKGQIQFDGKQALISNANKTCYINLDPVRFDYTWNNDGGKDLRIKNYGSYSQYFLWAESEATTKTDGDNQKEYIWANKLLNAVNESERDLFAVDPNNGVFTSGGIYAKYGRLGKYLLLNDSGLIYKQGINREGIIEVNGELVINKVETDEIGQPLTTSENNDIIYIGQERTRNGTLIPFYNQDNLYNSNRQYDHNFWREEHYTTNLDITKSELKQQGKTQGRYIIWAGSTYGDLARPRFGVEHDGTVHLNEAYISGAVHATALIIGNEDVTEYDRNRKKKTFYTHVTSKDNADLVGANPALLKDPKNNAPEGLWGGYRGGKNTGTCKKSYGDWLRPGDVWYIISNITPTFTNYKKQKENAIEIDMDSDLPNVPDLMEANLDFDNIYNLNLEGSYSVKSKQIGFKENSGFSYIEREHQYFQALSNDDNTKHILYIDEDNNYYDITYLVNELKKQAEEIQRQSNIVKEKKDQYMNNQSSENLKNYNAAQKELMDKQETYDELMATYNQIYTKLKTWVGQLNDTEGAAIDIANYSINSLNKEQLDNQVMIDGEDIPIENLPTIENVELVDFEDLFAENELPYSQMSYTEFIWEGTLEIDGETIESSNYNSDTKEWFGIWTEDNKDEDGNLPNGAILGQRINQDDLVYDPSTNLTDKWKHEPGYVNPKLMRKRLPSGDFTYWYDAPPGWRRVGIVNNETIWDALKHSDKTFHNALQSTTRLLTDNLNQQVKNIMNELGISQQKALEELNRQRKELVDMLLALQSNVTNTVFDAARNIRNGMDPISFYSDGNCYVFVTNDPIDTNISGIGVVPAGITVAQTIDQANDECASVMYLNSKRMGFYRTFDNIQLNHETISVTVPLLSYYNGAMALAGSMFFGLDYNNYIRKNNLNEELALDKDGNVIIESEYIQQHGGEAFNGSSDLPLYKNYIDGPNCRIVLGNGAIVIDGLDNGKDIDGNFGPRVYPFPNALKYGKQEGGTPFIYVGANSGENAAKGVVRIGAKNNGLGDLSLADFNFASRSYNQTITVPTKIVSKKSKETIPFTYNVLSVLPAAEKSENDKTESFSYVEDVTISDRRVSVQTGTIEIKLDRYDFTRTQDWTAEQTAQDGTYYPEILSIDETKSEPQNIEFNGDILVIAQQTNNNYYNGVGIIGNNDANDKVLFGPIRHKKSLTSDDLIDIRGYEDSISGGANSCWLTGWNFYGLNILSKNIYADGNIVSNKRVYIKDNDVYYQILHQSEVVNLIHDSEDRIVGVVNTNLDNINSSFQNVYDTLNDYNDAFGKIADAFGSLCSGMSTLASGVTSALSANGATNEGLGNALNAANAALEKSICKITFSASLEGDVPDGCYRLTPRIWANPLLNNGEGEEVTDSMIVTYADFASTTHHHGLTLLPNGNLVLTNPTSDNSTIVDLFETLDTRYMQLNDWHQLTGYNYWGETTVSLGYNGQSDSRKVELHLPWQGENQNELIINVWTALDAWTYSKEVIDNKVQTAFEKGWNDGWAADYIVAKTKASTANDTKDWYVKLRRPEYSGPGSDTLQISAKTDNDALAQDGRHINFHLSFDDSSKQIQVYADNDVKGENDNNPLAHDNAQAWTQGITDAVNQGEIDNWWVNKNNGISIQWKYHNDLTSEDVKSGVQDYKQDLLPQIEKGEYNQENKTYPFTVKLQGYFIVPGTNDNQPQDNTVIFWDEPIDASDAYDHGYDTAANEVDINYIRYKYPTTGGGIDSNTELTYARGWNDAVDALELSQSSITRPLNRDARTSNLFANATKTASYQYTYDKGYQDAADIVELDYIHFKYPKDGAYDTSYDLSYAQGWNNAANAVQISNDKIIYPIPRSTGSNNSFNSATTTESNTTQTYDAGYEAGWKAAADKFYRNGDTIYGPSSTVGNSDYYEAELSSSQEITKSGTYDLTGHWYLNADITWNK